MLRKLPNKLQFSVPFPGATSPYAQTVVLSVCQGEGSREVRDTARVRGESQEARLPLGFRVRSFRILWGVGEGLPFALGRWLTRGKNPWDVDSEPL